MKRKILKEKVATRKLKIEIEKDRKIEEKNRKTNRFVTSGLHIRIA